MTSILPPRPFLDAIALRAALVWLFFKGSSFAIGSEVAEVGLTELLVGSVSGALVLAAAVIVVLRVELWRRSELVFLANLGCSFTRVATFIALECAALEVTLRFAVG